MSLYIQIRVNDETALVTYAAQNISNDPCSTDACYRIAKYIPDKNGDSKRKYISGCLYHNRNDGALVLASKVLDFVIRNNGSKIR